MMVTAVLPIESSPPSTPNRQRKYRHRRPRKHSPTASSSSSSSAAAGDLHQHDHPVARLTTTTTTTITTTRRPAALELDERVRELQVYETEDHSRHSAALEYLQIILVKWVLSRSALTTSNNNGGTNNKNPWQRPRAALIPFGSYRLGVHRINSDFDLLALCPPECTREDFFQTFVQRLRDDGRISQVHPIPKAFTPVVKFALMGFQVDLVFARLHDSRRLLEFQQSRVSPLIGGPCASGLDEAGYFRIEDGDFVGLDEPSVRSLNGARVTQFLLEQIPLLDVYRTALKAVKEWARIAGIYSNALGFLGGINWAILVAWVCMRYPKANAPIVLEAFFRTFALWKWPTPVLLAPIQDQPPRPGVLTLPAWNPQANPRDGLHIMPIITPAYPSMNSSYNVGLSQLRRVQDEMIRACHALQKSSSSSSSSPKDYKVLFQKSDFFSRHRHYLQVTIRAQDPSDFVAWFRLVESRLRLLIADLETTQVHAWPFSRFFEPKSGGNVGPAPATTRCCREGKENNEGQEGGSAGGGDDMDISSRSTRSMVKLPTSGREVYFFIGLRFAPDLDSVDLRPLTLDFLHKVNSWEGRKPGVDLSIAHVTYEDLPRCVFEQEDDIDLELFYRTSDEAGNGIVLRKDIISSAGHHPPTVVCNHAAEESMVITGINTTPNKKCRTAGPAV